MTIDYIISAFTLPRQLVRLVSRLQYPNRRFYIHVDANTPPDVFDEIASGVATESHVTLLPRHPCQWGDFGHVRATLEGLGHVAASGFAADYVVLLTGQDYPIKSNRFVDDFFARHDGQSFMNHRPLPIAGLEDGGYTRLPARELPGGLQPYFGSGYWCLHRAAVECVVDFVSRRPDYVAFFESVRVPDEMFFQTILLNSPLAPTVVNDDLRLIKWPGPAVLTMANWTEIEQSADLFARKFDETADGRILDEIDRLLSLA